MAITPFKVIQGHRCPGLRGYTRCSAIAERPRCKVC